MVLYIRNSTIMMNTELLAQADILIKKQDYGSAEKIYLELLGKNPNDDVVQAFLGRLYIRWHKYKGAERVLEKAYNRRKTAPTVAALAFCKFYLKKYDEAVILYEELFRYDPNSEKIYIKIIDAFRNMGMYNFSHAYTQKYFMNYPDKEEAMVRMTQSYIDIGDIKEAQLMCAKTIQTFPKSGHAWVIAGTLQEFTDCNEEMAQDCYLMAIDYGFKAAYYHLAVSYQKVGRYKEAEENYKKMIELIPQEEYSQASLGTLYLTRKDIIKGYEYFMKREKSPDVYRLKNLWDGSECPDETLLLYCDQGYGDHLQFIRYLPFIRENFGRVKVLTRENCIDIFKRSYQHLDNVEFFDDYDNFGEYDKYVLASDVPYFLKMDFDHIPFPEGYLSINQEKKEYFKTKYFNNTDKLKVGLCWRAGGAGMRAAINRTINIDYFKKLLEAKKVQFYSFQLDDIFDATEKYPQITDLKDDLKTFDDTAAAMDNLDLFISADTSCAHLAGAIGKKTYLLIPYSSDWRWFDNTEKTEWYNSVEIIKQQERQDWFIEVDKLCEKLKEYI